jgi:hypothetical protein
MDGGRVLRAVLSIRNGRLEATRMAAAAGKYFCGLFVLTGIFDLPFRLFGLIGPFGPNLMLAFIGFYIYHAGRMEYRMVMMEHQAGRPAGYTEDRMDVEVSPPPYAGSESGLAAFKDKLRSLFRR